MPPVAGRGGTPGAAAAGPAGGPIRRPSRGVPARPAARTMRGWPRPPRPAARRSRWACSPILLPPRAPRGPGTRRPPPPPPPPSPPPRPPAASTGEAARPPGSPIPAPRSSGSGSCGSRRAARGRRAACASTTRRSRRDYAQFDAVPARRAAGRRLRGGRAAASPTARSRSPGRRRGRTPPTWSSRSRPPALLARGLRAVRRASTSDGPWAPRARTRSTSSRRRASSRAWVDPEAGELTVKGWTNRPEVKRGGPVTDPVTKAPHWFEARPEILYDRARLEGPRATARRPTRRRSGARRTRCGAARRTCATPARPTPPPTSSARPTTWSPPCSRATTASRCPRPLATRFARLPFRWK